MTAQSCKGGAPMPASRRRQRERAFFYGSLLVLLLFGLLQAKTDVTLAGNESTRFATIRAIAEQNTFAIDGKVFRSVDRVVRDGKVYSDKPPLLPLLLGAACKIPVTLLGWSFEEQYGLLIYLVNFLFFTGINLAIFFLFYRRLRRMKGTFYVRWLLAFSLCAGSWLLSYSVTINNHTPAALLLLLWFLLLEEACRTRGHGAALGAGLAAGLAFTIEVPVGAIIGLAGLPAVFRTAVEGRDWRFPAAYCLGGAVTAALFPVVNYLAFGTVMPLYLAGTGTYQPGAAFHFQGVYWWETLFGRRGLFSYQPLVLYHPTRKNVAELQERIRDVMDEIHLSDHGEDVYDNDKSCFCHAENVGSPHMFEIPFVLWLSERYKKLNPQMVRKLPSYTNRLFNTQHLIHSLPTLSGLNSPDINHKLNLFSPQYDKTKVSMPPIKKSF